MAKAKVRLHQTSHDLPPETRQAMVELINDQLATLSDLYSQSKQAHWNVKGMEFYQLHELFDDLAAAVLPFVDVVAERAATLGGDVLGTARMAATRSALAEFPLDLHESREFVEALCERYGIAAKELRQAIDQADEADDKDTADMFTDISREIDKSFWFLEAHLRS